MAEHWTYEQAIEALQAADAAGNTEEAKILAGLARRLSTESQPPPFSPLQAAGAAASGVTTALIADVGGAPVDLATFAINTLVTGGQGKVIVDPPGGSAAARQGLATLGIGFEDISDVPERYRGFAVAGETFGASIPAGTGPLAATGRAAGIFGPIVSAARSRPRAFATAEAVSAGAAGAGAAVAERQAPGDPLVRLGAEIVGGFLGPTALVPIASRLGRYVRLGADAIAGTGAERQAAETVQRIAVAAGEDPAQIAATLRGDTAAASATSAQRAGSEALSAIESAVVRESRALGGAVEKQTKDAILEFNAAVRAAVESGNPEALRRVALARERWWTSLIDVRLKDANDQVLRSMALVMPGNAAVRREANRRAKHLLEGAAKDFRAEEKALWRETDGDYPIEPDGAFSARAQVREEILPSERLPEPIEVELDRWQTIQNNNARIQGKLAAGKQLDEGEVIEQIPAWQIQRLRSRTLAHARLAARDGDDSLVRHLGMIADGLLDDLDVVPGDAAEAARTFSRLKRDRLNRTSARIALARTGEGGAATPDELVLERAFGSGGPEAEVRFAGLEEAVSPVPGGSAAFVRRTEGRPAAMRQTQEEFLTDVVGGIVDPATGRVSPERLAKWRSDNRDTLARHPRLDERLRNAEQAQRVVNRLAPQLERGRQAGNRLAAFAKIARVEDPARAFVRALQGDTPVRDVTAFFKLAARGGSEAKAGARAALLDALLQVSRTGDGLISPVLLEGAFLGGAIQKAGLNTGVFTTRQIENVRLLVDEMKRFTVAVGSGRQLDEVLDPDSAMFDLFARYLGANLGARAGGASGSSLVLAHAGSQRMRRLLNKLPRQKIVDLISEAVTNPERMAALLTKRTSVAAVNRGLGALGEIIYRAGVLRPAVAARLLQQPEQNGDNAPRVREALERVGLP